MLYCKYCCVHNISILPNISSNFTKKSYTWYHHRVVWLLLLLFFFYRIVSQTVPLLWILWKVHNNFVKVLIAAIKPKHNGRLLNLNNGCHLCCVTESSMALKSQCLSQIWITRQGRIEPSWRQHFDRCRHFVNMCPFVYADKQPPHVSSQEVAVRCGEKPLVLRRAGHLPGSVELPGVQCAHIKHVQNLTCSEH